MKTLKLILTIFSLSILLLSCSKDDSNNAVAGCEDATAKTLAAKQAFDSATPTNNTELCNAYKVALQNQKNVCGDESGTLQNLIGGLNCT